MSLTPSTARKGFDYEQGVAPDSPYAGLTWFDTTEQKGKVYTGTAWVQLANAYQTTGSKYGFQVGGVTQSAQIFRMTFPFDSGTMAWKSNLNHSRYSLAAAANSTQYGFVLGGGATGTSYAQSYVTRFAFPLDTGSASVVGSLNSTGASNAGFNSSTNGYKVGQPNEGASWYSGIDRIAFPFNSGTATKTCNISQTTLIPRDNGVSAANSSTMGYAHCGWGNSSILRFFFNSDATVYSDCALAGTRMNTCGCNSSQYMFTLGGNISSVERLSFALSGAASVVGKMAVDTYYMTAVNTSYHGFTMGGYNFSMVQRISFPFNSGVAVTTGIAGFSYQSSCGVDGTDFGVMFV